MKFLNHIQKNIFYISAAIAFLVSLNSCGIWDPADARKVSPNAQERVKKNLEEGRGITLGGALGGGSKTNYQFASSNPMWRATLEILDFLPLANVDYSGGIITTDWYNEGTASDESIKITIRFLSNEIRADGIKVIVHKNCCLFKNSDLKFIFQSTRYFFNRTFLFKITFFFVHNYFNSISSYFIYFQNK